MSSYPRHLAGPVLGAALLLAGATGNALAQPADQAAFGQHVASCAQENLGQRLSPPQVTCTHDGHTHTFANFGEMVQHLQDHQA